MPSYEAPSPTSERSGDGAGAARALAAYLVVFALLCLPWLRAAAHAIPLGDAAGADRHDARLHIYLLSWVASALVRAPGRLYDASFGYPAPAQLTGSEHFLSSQLLFGPLFWLSGNPVLAANLLVAASYPLAALAMERLLVALGCAPAGAWVGGLAFAFGPLRVPANLQLPQYLNLYLPLVALGLVRLRERPTVGRAAWLGLAFAAGIFSSYYMAAMLSAAGAAWGALELLRRGQRRLRFTLLATTAAGLALTLLVVFSLPYLARPEAQVPSGPLETTYGAHDHLHIVWVLLRIFAPWFGAWPLVLAAMGLAALPMRTPSRRAAAAGVVLVVLGFLCVLPPPPLGAALAATPARVVRYPWRHVVVMGFGTALLTGAAIEVAWRALGTRAGAVVAAIAATGLLSTRGAGLVTMSLDEVTAVAAAPVYRAVGEVARSAGGGPLLELPTKDARGRPLEPEAMVGSAWHRLPLIGGHTGYPPPHRWFVLRALARLPAPEALADLVDMTHLRWLLLHPPADWAPAGAARDAALDRYGLVMGADVRTRLLSLPGVVAVFERDGWVLARIDRVPAHPEWFAAIAAPRPGTGPLGAPLQPLPADAAVAHIAAEPAPARARPGLPLRLRLRLTNAGTAGWPAATPGRRPYTVALHARWRRLHDEGDAAALPVQRFDLARDVPAGESLVQEITLATPRRPDTYELEVTLEQDGGPRFDGPGNERLRLPLAVAAEEHP